MRQKVHIPMVIIFLTCFIFACGKPSTPERELRVKLVSANQETRESLFWGVDSHEIQWLSNSHGIRSYPWDGVSPLAINPEQGDRIIYVGRGGGIVLLKGEAKIDDSGLIIVPLARVI